MREKKCTITIISANFHMHDHVHVKKSRYVSDCCKYTFKNKHKRKNVDTRKEKQQTRTQEENNITGWKSEQTKVLPRTCGIMED